MAEKTFKAPHPGSREMPRWDTGELIDAPRFTWRNWFALLGPGLVLGGASIGGGEWLLGPRVTARLRRQPAVACNAERSWPGDLQHRDQPLHAVYGRADLHRKVPNISGPKVLGAGLSLSGPRSVFPYLAANAATPVATLLKGGVVPNSGDERRRLLADERFWATSSSFWHSFRLLFGGKIYNSLRAVMTFKIVVVFGFLLFLAFFFSQADTWVEILTGFFKFGTVPIQAAADTLSSGAPTSTMCSLRSSGPRPAADRFHSYRVHRRAGGHRRFRRADEHADQQLHEGPGLGHGAPCGRHTERFRRPRAEPFARRSRV